jgi:beta-N-acetylhexosaminidase
VKRHLLVAIVVVGLGPIGAIARPAAARPKPASIPPPQMVAAAAYSRMTPAQRVGQLFMAGVPSTGATRAQLASLHKHRVGNAILITDTSERRRIVRAVTTSLTGHLTDAGVAPFISTDQEGGAVQRLTGEGFGAMPSALKQGAMTDHALRAASRTWGSQLAAAGVTLNLAPVADTVPAKHARANQPIGRYGREFGHTPSVVATHVVAFLRGMDAAGVDTAVKHFPGLGRASGNTDTRRHVTDPTTRNDPYLKPFRDGIHAGTQFVMVSSATYPHIDRHRPACFSKIIITSMLRGDYHFHGVVISDDFGTPAMSGTPVASRAVEFFTAGGTMLVDTTIGQIPAMIHAVVATAAASSSFAATIHAATMNVLVAKATAHLIKP